MDNLFSPAIILCKLPCWQYFSLSHFESVPRIILTRFWFSGSNLKEESSSNCLHIHLSISWEKHLFQVKYKEHLKVKWYLSHLPVDIYIFLRCQKKIIRSCQLSTHSPAFSPQDANSRIGTQFKAYQKHQRIWFQGSSHITKPMLYFIIQRRYFGFQPGNVLFLSIKNN